MVVTDDFAVETLVLSDICNSTEVEYHGWFRDGILVKVVKDLYALFHEEGYKNTIRMVEDVSKLFLRIHTS